LIDNPPTNVANLVARLKGEVRATGGLKKDSSSYEAIAGAIGANDACCARARALLNAIAEVAQGTDNPLFVADPNHPTIKVFTP
jgi:methionine salvage enolase-phosphatase E1